MLFNSLEFLIFFPLVVAFYFAIPWRYRWMLLLAASYYFYACARIEYTLLLAFSTLVDYLAARKMERFSEKEQRKPYLYLSLFSNLGLLFIFKYADFVNENIRLVFNEFNVLYDVPELDLLLPVGISFYTFQTLSYTIDVYHGKRPAERHLGIFALYVSFFPQLVAGPIERSTSLLPQFHRKPVVTSLELRQGFALILWGFFKKVVIADSIAIYVNAVYGAPDAYSFWAFLLAAYLFIYQLYCDFSGYSDIAIGTALIMGYHLSSNFNRPFAARTISESWSRWHISLTSWIRDYCYQPLFRLAKSRGDYLFTIVIVSLLFGLWHGAAWHFVFFGLFTAFALILGHQTKGLRRGMSQRLFANSPCLHHLYQLLVIQLFFVTSGIFFRLEHMSDLLIFSDKLFQFEPLGNIFVSGFGRWDLLIVVLSIALLESIQWLAANRPQLKENWHFWPRYLRWPIYYLLIFVIIGLGEFHQEPFIYFQF